MAQLGGHRASQLPDPDWALGSNHSDVFAGRFSCLLATGTAWTRWGQNREGLDVAVLSFL